MLVTAPNDRGSDGDDSSDGDDGDDGHGLGLVIQDNFCHQKLTPTLRTTLRLTVA